MAERLNIEGLRYVQAVAETSSFSAAARAYGVTQPALSSGVAKLEERLGARLFDRSPRGVVPTAFGAQILPLVDRALTALDAISAEANRRNAPVGQNIRMGVSPLINPKLVAAAYNAVCRLPSPDGARQLVLREANMGELKDALIEGDLDLILVPSVAPLPRYSHRVIDSEPLVLVESAPADEVPVELEQLHDKQMILLPDACGLTSFTRDLFTAHELPVRAYPGEPSSYRVLEEWANLGLGSAMLPQSKLTAPDTRHRPVLDDGSEVEIFYEAVWDPNSLIAADLQDLADQLATQQA